MSLEPLQRNVYISSSRNPLFNSMQSLWTDGSNSAETSKPVVCMTSGYCPHMPLADLKVALCTVSGYLNCFNRASS